MNILAIYSIHSLARFVRLNLSISESEFSSMVILSVRRPPKFHVSIHNFLTTGSRYRSIVLLFTT